MEPTAPQVAYPVQTGHPGSAYPPQVHAQPGSYPQTQAGIYPQKVTAATTTVVQEPRPSSYAWLSWLTCLLCCWPIGIVAIIFSNKVNLVFVKLASLSTTLPFFFQLSFVPFPFEFNLVVQISFLALEFLL